MSRFIFGNFLILMILWIGKVNANRNGKIHGTIDVVIIPPMSNDITHLNMTKQGLRKLSTNKFEMGQKKIQFALIYPVDNTGDNSSNLNAGFYNLTGERQIYRQTVLNWRYGAGRIPIPQSIRIAENILENADQQRGKILIVFMDDNVKPREIDQMKALPSNLNMSDLLLYIVHTRSMDDNVKTLNLTSENRIFVVEGTNLYRKISKIFSNITNRILKDICEKTKCVEENGLCQLDESSALPYFDRSQIYQCGRKCEQDDCNEMELSPKQSPTTPTSTSTQSIVTETTTATPIATRTTGRSTASITSTTTDSPPTTATVETSSAQQNETNPENQAQSDSGSAGLPGWAIGLIVIGSILVVSGGTALAYYVIRKPTNTGESNMQVRFSRGNQ